MRVEADGRIRTSTMRIVQDSGTIFRVEEGHPLIPRPRGSDAHRTGHTDNRGLLMPFVTRLGHGKDEECEPLVSPGPGTSSRKDRTLTVLMIVLVFLGAFLWFGVIVMLTMIYWQVTDHVKEVGSAVQPYVASAVSHSMSILENIDASTATAHRITNGAEQISSQAVPAIQHALNESNVMLNRLEALMANPVLHVSLGGPTATTG